MITAAVKEHLHGLLKKELVIGALSTPLALSKGMSYISSGFKGESLLRIGPDVTVAREAIP
jgi:hypothetical protein